MYKHRQRLHKAEYAACKSQAMPPNIIKAAKSMPNTLRTKRRFVPSNAEPQEEFISTPTPTPVQLQTTLTTQPPPPTTSSCNSLSQSSHSPPPPIVPRNPFLNPPLLPIKFEGYGYQQ